MVGVSERPLVVAVGEALARRCGPEAFQGRLAAARREVHDDAVVLVDSCELPDDRDINVPYRFEAAIRHGGRLCPASDVPAEARQCPVGRYSAWLCSPCREHSGPRHRTDPMTEEERTGSRAPRGTHAYRPAPAGMETAALRTADAYRAAPADRGSLQASRGTPGATPPKHGVSPGFPRTPFPPH